MTLPLDGEPHTSLPLLTCSFRQDAGALLSQLIADYPKSNRAGCAMLHLARRAPGEERERELKRTTKDFNGAWCENGVQVGALARALLAMYYAGLDKYDEAGGRQKWCGCFRAPSRIPVRRSTIFSSAFAF